MYAVLFDQENLLTYLYAEIQLVPGRFFSHKPLCAADRAHHVDCIYLHIERTELSRSPRTIELDIATFYVI